MCGVSEVCGFYVKGRDTVLRVRCVERFLIAGLVVSVFYESVSTGRLRVDRQMKLFLSYAGRQNILLQRTRETTVTVVNQVCHYHLLFVHLVWEVWSKLIVNPLKHIGYYNYHLP